jgi:2-C-methyl-D-erythritol 4-phosphate cytidylyltransferase
MKTIAAILAAGRGVRAGFSVPKQLVSVAGHPLLWHSLRAFQDSTAIDAIVVVTSPECMDVVRLIIKENGFSKVAGIVEGGAKRSDSSLAALRFCENESVGGNEVNLLLHDAARPLVTGAMIAAIVRALGDFEAATIAAPASDTIAASDGAGAVADIPDRRKMFVVQTPQAFRLATLKKAFACAAGDPDFVATDDCGVVKKYLPDVKIALVENREPNQKLTYPADLPLIEDLLKQRRAG